MYLTREIGHQQFKITALSATLEKFLRFLASQIEFLLWAAHAWSLSLFASFQFSNSYRGWHNPFLSWVRSWDHGIRRFFGPCAYQISVRLESRQRCFLGKANRTWLRPMVQLREEICTQTLKQAKPIKAHFQRSKTAPTWGRTCGCSYPFHSWTALCPRERMTTHRTNSRNQICVVCNAVSNQKNLRSHHHGYTQSAILQECQCHVQRRLSWSIILHENPAQMTQTWMAW